MQRAKWDLGNLQPNTFLSFILFAVTMIRTKAVSAKQQESGIDALKPKMC